MREVTTEDSVTIKGWVVQWFDDGTSGRGWYADETQQGRDMAKVSFRQRNPVYVLPTRREARAELLRCKAAWAEHRLSVKHRIRRATVTLKVED